MRTIPINDARKRFGANIPGGEDLQEMNPWRGIAIVSPENYLIGKA